MSAQIIVLTPYTPLPEPEPAPLPPLLPTLAAGQVFACDIDPETALVIAEKVAISMRHHRSFPKVMRGVLSDLAHLGFTAADLCGELEALHAEMGEG